MDSHPLFDLLSPRFAAELAEIAAADFRPEAEELRFLVHRRYLDLKARGLLSGQASAPAREVESALPGQDEATSGQDFAGLLEEQKTRLENLNTVVRSGEPEKKKKKKKPADLEARIVHALCEGMDGMGYLLVDLNDFVPGGLRPLLKKELDLPLILRQMESRGFFISLDLDLAREKHELIYKEGHDFFLARMEYRF